MSRKRILVVEDEPLISMDIETMLTELGHEVISTPSVKETLDVLEAISFDLAILDYKVSDGDTTALATDMKRRGLPFIVCSGSEGLTEFSEAFAGARFLAKPYTSEGLLGALTFGGVEAASR
jgi:DNA-binding NtrC family response regulator